jgi:hypothetical protein
VDGGQITRADLVMGGLAGVPPPEKPLGFPDGLAG